MTRDIRFCNEKKANASPTSWKKQTVQLSFREFFFKDLLCEAWLERCRLMDIALRAKSPRHIETTIRFIHTPARVHIHSRDI